MREYGIKVHSQEHPGCLPFSHHMEKVFSEREWSHPAERSRCLCVCVCVCVCVWRRKHNHPVFLSHCHICFCSSSSLIIFNLLLIIIICEPTKASTFNLSEGVGFLPLAKKKKQLFPLCLWHMNLEKIYI